MTLQAASFRYSFQIIYSSQTKGLLLYSLIHLLIHTLIHLFSIHTASPYLSKQACKTGEVLSFLLEQACECSAKAFELNS